MVKQIELRRHTDNDGDVLTDEGVEAALRIGDDLAGDYEVVVSTGAQRATQTAACFIAALGLPVDRGVIVDTDLRSDDEDRWREIYSETGSGELSAFEEADPDFVQTEAKQLSGALRRLFDSLDEDGRALAVGHSPTNEAAVYGLSGQQVAPLGKGEGVLITQRDGDYELERLEA